MTIERMTNLNGVHDHPTVFALMPKPHIHPVWIPTDASWSNLIEGQFEVLTGFTIANTDDAAHTIRRRRIYRCVRYRHRKVGTKERPLRQIGTVKLEPH